MSQFETLVFFMIFLMIPLTILILFFKKEFSEFRKMKSYDIKAGKERSSFWYALPLSSGLLGAMLAYGIIKHDDPKKAKECMVMGLGLTLAGIVIFLIYGFFTFYFRF